MRAKQLVTVIMFLQCYQSLHDCNKKTRFRKKVIVAVLLQFLLQFNIT
jgi:hypothetical protein